MHQLSNPAALTIVMVLLGCSGCGRNLGPGGSGAWLSVSTDTAALEDARKRSVKAEQDAYEQLIPTAAQALVYIDFDAIEILERHREDAVSRLKKIIGTSQNPEQVASAGIVLCRMQVVDGRSAVSKTLREGSPAIRIRVLHAIDGGMITIADDEKNPYQKFILDDPDLVAALLAQLDAKDSQIMKAAVQSCGMLEVPGATDRFLKMLEDPQVPDRGRLLFWLSKGPLTRELLEMAKQVVSAEPASENSDMSLFEAFAQHSDPAFRLAGREELKKWIATVHDDQEFGFRGDRIGALSTLAKTSTESDLEWLRQTVKTERGYYAQILLSALIRLEGPAGKAHLLKLLADPKQRSTAVDVAREVFAGTGEADIVRELHDAGHNADQQVLNELCDALVAIGGDQTTSVLRELIPRLEADNQQRYLARLDERPLDVLKQRLIESKLLDENTVSAALDALAKRDKSPDAQPPGLLDVLSEAGIVVGFDAETGMLPCRHDLLLEQFAKQSQGLFQPEAPSEEWHQSGPEDDEAEYTLRFIFHGRLYQARLRNLGDWYDVERIVTLINRSLKDAQLAEEFVPMATGDQTAMFIFADRKLLEPIAAEFHLSLSQNLNESMQTGKDFEKRVIEQMEK